MPIDSRNTPVLLIIFNRPDKVEKLMGALAVAKPRYLYIAADGPRSDRPDDNIKCNTARTLATRVTWECEVVTNFSETNKGCRLGVSSGISWFFSQVEAGIILEDDCIPTPAFFDYTTELLHTYNHDTRIMHINGSSFLKITETNLPPTSYYASALPLVWGWASWQRAWAHYDIKMTDLVHIPETLKKNNIFSKKTYITFWYKLFRHIQSAQVDTWDAQWVYTIMINGGITITPAQNLIENIGFDSDATHTTENSPYALKGVTLDNYRLTHPTELSINRTLDNLVMDRVFIVPFWKKIHAGVKSKLEKIFS